jgi:hypothetical protein
MPMEARFKVDVYEVEKPLKVRPEVRGMLKGLVSGRMAGRMKREAVFCPVLKQERAFLECFACSSFIRRVQGVVDCSGEWPEGVPREE